MRDIRVYIVVFIGVFLIMRNSNAQECNIVVENISYAEGLENSYINDITKDDKGFVWFAGDESITRFDGNNYLDLPYANDSDFQKLFPIQSIQNYTNDRIVIASEKGQIALLDIKHRSLTNIASLPDNMHIKKIELSNNTAIIALQNNGIVELDLETKEIKHLLKKQSVNQVFKDQLGIVWLLCEDGLYIKKNKSNYKVIDGTVGKNIIDLTEDKKGNFWIVADNKLYALDNRLKLKPLLSLSNLGNMLIKYIQYADSYILLFDAYGQYWEYQLDNNVFSECAYGERMQFNSQIKCKYTDEQGVLWLGTNGDGVLLCNTKSVNGAFKLFNDKGNLLYNPHAICFDNKNQIWTVDKNRLLVFDEEGSFINQIDLQNSIGYKSGIQFSTIVWLSKRLWLVAPNQGLFYLDISQKQLVKWSNDKVKNSSIKNIAVQNKVLFVSTNSQLFAIDTTGTIINEIKVGKEPFVLIENNQNLYAINTKSVYKIDNSLVTQLFDFKNPIAGQINDIAIKENKVFISTIRNGVWTGLIRDKKVDFELLNLGQNQLPSKNIVSINLSKFNKLIIATKNGLGVYDLTTKNIRKYYRNDGLISEEFNNKPIASNREKGLWYFPVKRGIVQVNERALRKNSSKLSILVTGLNIDLLNKQIKDPVYLNILEIPYGNRSFTLNLSVPDYAHLSHVTYHYKIKEAGEKWVSLGNSHRANFSNLDQGEYNVVFKGTSGNGEPTSETTVTLSIKPPFYASNLFKIIIGLSFIALLVLGYWIKLRRARKRGIELERIIEKRTRELKVQNKELEIAKNKAQQSDRAKSDFMATVSHEIRTPMNGILGTIDILKASKLNSDQLENIDTIAESGDNMLAIINEILDFANIETGKLKIVPEVFNIYNTIEVINNNFKARAAKANLSLLCFISPNVPIEIESDKNRFIQIITNLVSNAIKFTKTGYVYINVEFLHNELIVSVIDSGIGIENDKINSIFKPFTQADSSSTRLYGGTGLGLTICQSMVQLLDGEITVRSELGKGSTFQFSIPVKVVTENKPTVKIQTPLQYLIIDQCAKCREVFSKQLDVFGLNGVSIAAIDELKTLGSKVFDVILISSKQFRIENKKILESMSKRILIIDKEVHPYTLDDELIKSNYCVVTSYLNKNKLCQFLGIEKYKAKLNGLASTGIAEPITSLRILLAEDNKINQLVTKKLFKQLGYTIDIVENGELAVEAYYTKQYDIILMDLLMPVTDGETATHEIRKEFPDINNPYIIAFSANIFNKSKEDYLELGFSDVLSKPAKLDHLKSIIEKLKPVLIHQNQS